jgi:hypothetical protein
VAGPSAGVQSPGELIDEGGLVGMSAAAGHAQGLPGGGRHDQVGDGGDDRPLAGGGGERVHGQRLPA